MSRPPRSPSESIFAGGVVSHVLVFGLLMGVVSLGVGYVSWQAGAVSWQTLLLTTLILARTWHVLAIRTGRESVLRVGLLSNRPLLWAVALTVALQLAVVYVPFLQTAFGTVPLSATELGLSLALSGVVFVAAEMAKRR